MALTNQERSRVINCCNRDIVPDPNFNRDDQYISDWFVEYFSYTNNQSLKKQLGEAFYQARFNYKMMNVLQLPLYKQRGIVKFQIIQYASICEAILDYTITSFFKAELKSTFFDVEYTNFPNALSNNTEITNLGEKLFVCKKKTREKPLKFVRIGDKTDFAVRKLIISNDIKLKVDALYDLRNNVHILKATEVEYYPKLKEAKEAFLLMQEFVQQTKNYFQTHA